MQFEISNEQVEALRELLAATKEYRAKAALEGLAWETLRLITIFTPLITEKEIYDVDVPASC